MTYPIMSPLPIFIGLDGHPLDGGFIYLGVANQNPETNPVAVYWDSAATIPAAQPIKTLGGYPIRNGNPARIYVASDYSITVRDSKRGIVLTKPTSAEVEFINGAISQSGGANYVGFLPKGTGAVVTNVGAKLNELEVSVTDFMTDAQRADVLAGTASIDVSGAVQKAVDYCATFTRWPTLVIPGRCLMGASVNIDRLVDTTLSEFRIVGRGTGAGFYTTAGVTLFDSTIATTVDPKSEFISFEDLQFETSSIFNASYVLSKKFLRCKFTNCRFYIMRCQISTMYAQTLHFINCGIRNTPASFINCVGSYDISFNHCIIENGSTVLRSIDATRGAAGVRFIDSVIEGIQASIVVTSGASGFDLIGCHLESNFSPEFNFFGGGPANGSITAIGNYIYNPGGATFYYGPTTKVFSAGNTAFPSVLHSNAIQVTDLVSCADNCSGGISDSANYSVVNGVYRAGNLQDSWTHSAKHFTKNTAGEFGMGWTPLAGTRFLIFGQDQTNTKYALNVCDSAGNSIMSFRNDRVVSIAALQNFANDAAAATGGIPVGGLYRTASAVMVRVV